MKTAMRFRGLAAAVFSATALLNSAHAASGDTIHLAMDSLPSAQGWTYDSCWWGCYVPPAELAWTANGSVLTLADYPGAFGAYSKWSQVGAVNPSKALTIEARIAITASSGGDFFQLTASTLDRWIDVGLSATELRVYGASSTTFYSMDATKFHDFVIAAVPNGLVTVSVDGQTVYSGNDAWLAADPHVELNSIVFGDWHSGASGTAAIASYSFTQNAAPVPEAGTLPLMALGLAGSLLWRRRGNGRR